MLSKINPTTTQAWLLLTKHFEAEMNHASMRKLFAENENRFQEFSIIDGDILFDYSKNIINNKTIQLLLQLANECKLQEAINEMFSGAKINETENRAVLH
ncbi:MAG TPA: glucose-6-phosphate isomerase, partial [Chitinophagaceae bacterium]|nr:glucose-6-phosphate isomerase [Chitinophagaceae bacterium]